MLNPKTEIIFPPSIIPELAGLRSESWRILIRNVLGAPKSEPDKVAFVLLMARLNNCAACNGDTYRAMQGCIRCSQQVLQRRKESDEELVAQFHAACQEIKDT